MTTLIILFIILLHSAAFATICGLLGAQKQIGGWAGTLLGMLLGIIGLVIVLFSPPKEPYQLTDQLQKYKILLDNGLISESEYENLKGKFLENYPLV